MNRWELCNERLAQFIPSRFLEIGVRRGVVGRQVHATIKLGVDPFPVGSAQKYYTHLFVQTSDEFFASQTRHLNLDVVLVDGLHHADQVMRDVLHSLYHLHPLGTIILHDCNPLDEGSQRVPQQQDHWNGDGWKVIVRLRATRADLHVYTLDADEGLGVITRSHHDESLIPHPGDLTWEGLVQHRTEWLGLVAC